MTDGTLDRDLVMRQLKEPFDGSLVKKKGKYDYISHGLVTQRLNNAVPDWSYRVAEVFTSQDAQGRTHCEGVLVGLTIGGVERMEGGGPQRQDGFANEIKNAISDAIKRAAMRFGVALEIWESLVDSEFDEDVHPDLVAQPVSANGAEPTPIRRQDQSLERVKEVAGAATIPLRNAPARRPPATPQPGSTPSEKPYGDSAPQGCNGATVVKFLQDNGFTGDNAYKMIGAIEAWVAETFPERKAPKVVGSGDWDPDRKQHKVWPSDIYNYANYFFELCKDVGDPAVAVAAGGVSVADDDEVPF